MIERKPMYHVGTSKIGKLSARGITYPQLRLPPDYSDIIGRIAAVIETEHNGKRAFLIVPSDSTVLKPSVEVLKLQDKNAYLQRLQDLESEIEELKSTLFSNSLEECSKIKNSGPGRIRTGDLRRVKAPQISSALLTRRVLETS
ncbi:MAG: hypothetical protein ACXVIS_09930 [Halobacteriota archaeon]